jgi:signal transduction histidine kinase
MSGGGLVRVTVALGSLGSRVAQEGWVQIRISDTGPGIPSEKLRQVFDPFYTTKSDGTGLGLAICHSILEQHQGEIEIESEEGSGTTVVVRLPLAGRQAWPTS